MNNKLLTGILLSIFVLLQYAGWIAPGGLLSYWRLNQQVFQERQTNQLAAKRNQALATEIYYLKNTRQAIEAHARSDLGMIKRGEIFYELPF